MVKFEESDNGMIFTRTFPKNMNENITNITFSQIFIQFCSVLFSYKQDTIA